MRRQNSSDIVSNILCGCNVLKSTYIFALIGVILWSTVLAFVLLIGFFILIFMPEEAMMEFFVAWLIIIFVLHAFILSDALIIYGHKKKKSGAYIPYLILNGLEFILGYIFIAILIIWGILLPISDDFFINTIVESEAHTRIFCFMLAIVLIQFNLYRHWKWYIVFRAYRYVKQISIIKPPSYDEVEALKNNDNYES